MRNFDYITNPAKLLTPEIVQMVGSIHEHKGKQELFLEANIDELKTLLEVTLIQSTGASNRIEGIFSVCSLSNLFFRFHTTTLTEACSNELKQHHL